MRPGREHDTTCARTHPGLLDARASEGRVVLANLGYEGEGHRPVLPVKKIKSIKLTVDQVCFNALR